jgi:hypothetical protein
MEAEAHQPSDNDSAAIDVVIAWVDGDDPRLVEKRNHFLKSTGEKNISGAHPTRFASTNEIRYCLLSLFKFAPFIRNVFIVTDGQDPNLWDDIKTYYPERFNSIRIVDHKEIFKGYEQYLPIFNSTAIETMVWRIDGLSEQFVYLNDDFFLIREIKPKYWFLNNKPVLRGRWTMAPFKKVVGNRIKALVNKYLYKNSSYQHRFSFFIGQWNAASLLGMKVRYFLNGHTPYVFRVSTFEKFYKKNNHLLEKNISYRFRDQSQYNLTTLANHLEILEGNKQIEKPRIGYLNPAYHSAKRFNRKMKRCETDSRIKSICVQSLDLASKENQERIFNWLNMIIGIN